MKKLNLNLSFGSDPEFCLWSVTKKKIVSSIPVLKKYKHNPIKLGDNINFYADNVLAETSFPPVANTEGMIDRLRTVFTRIQESLGDKYRLLPKASHVYDADELKEKKAWEAGCDPNFNVYDGTMNPPADFEAGNGLRSGSCHIHIGENEGKLSTFEMREAIIKLMDIYVGAASILFDKDDSAAARRALYGKAGEFRMCPYGAEYRVLGPFVLRSPKTIELTFDLVNHALSHIDNGTDQDALKLVKENDVIVAINNNDKQLAEKVLIKAQLPASLMKRVKQDYNPDFYQDWKI